MLTLKGAIRAQPLTENSMLDAANNLFDLSRANLRREEIDWGALPQRPILLVQPSDTVLVAQRCNCESSNPRNPDNPIRFVRL
ncbi:MAG: hypothetical protein WB615_03265 [Candidatus Tumulicola sp.]